MRPNPVRRTRDRKRRLRRETLTLSMSWEVKPSRPSHRHRRHRCERPLRMDSPSTGWVTALAGLLARGSLLSCARPSRFPSGHVDAGSPLTVAGAATDFCKFATYEPADSRVPSFVPGVTQGTSTSKCSFYRPHKSSRAAGGGGQSRCINFAKAGTRRRSPIVFPLKDAIGRILTKETSDRRDSP